MDGQRPKTVVLDDDAFSNMRNVSFFERIHRHLPDDFCGVSPLGPCNYRPDGVAINSQNAPVDELRTTPGYAKIAEELRLAVRGRWEARNLPKEDILDMLENDSIGG